MELIKQTIRTSLSRKEVFAASVMIMNLILLLLT